MKKQEISDMLEIQTALIIDDDHEAGKLLESRLKPYSCVDIVAIYNDPERGLNAILKKKIDIAFIAIKMTKLNGIELLKQIRYFKPDVKVVCVTAFPDYAIEAFRNEAFDFVLKPLDGSEVGQVVKRLCESKIRVPAVVPYQKVLFKSLNGSHYLDSKDIVYLEADGAYTRIVCEDKELHSSLNLGKCLEAIDDRNFIRISRKYAINTSYLTFINHKDKKCHMDYSEGSIVLEFSLKLSELQAELQEP
ncbi:response regulator transcription factor [Puteibacter caeruleilacunae]|nr:response regulator transcription factor [Puteibacter caeruleilacunae]